MKTYYTSFLAAIALMVFLSGCDNATTSESDKTVSEAPALATTTSVDSMDLEAAAERMRQTSKDMQVGIKQARVHREMLEAQHEVERKNEAERVRQQANKDAAQLAALKSAKERQALEAAQALARQEAAERAAKAERERLAALEAQRALERNTAKVQAAKTPAAKVAPVRKLGGDVNFGSDI